ncbi:MAG: hypothetical protein Q4C70_04055 [Planctomycetia bacterium]|nr:hypothetical protein [Planctomycetia bacterium]
MNLSASAYFLLKVTILSHVQDNLNTDYTGKFQRRAILRPVVSETRDASETDEENDGESDEETAFYTVLDLKNRTSDTRKTLCIADAGERCQVILIPLKTPGRADLLAVVSVT